jgi:hypothetical protein
LTIKPSLSVDSETKLEDNAENDDSYESAGSFTVENPIVIPANSQQYNDSAMVQEEKKSEPEELDSGLYIDQDTLDEDEENENEPVRVVIPADTINSSLLENEQKFTDSVDEKIDLKSFWPAFIEFLIHERPNMGSFLSLASAFHAAESTIDLKFAPAYRFQYFEITKKNNREEIEQHLKKFARRDLQLNITIDSKPVEDHQENYIKSVAHIPSTIDDEIEREPIIKTILDIFDGEVLD